MHALVADLRDKVAKAALGGGDKARAKHAARGKLLPRERIDLLLDPGAPFLELSQLAAFGMYDDDAPGAGLISGIGRVAGVDCLIIANDATVKGGTYYPMTVKKHLRAQEIARDNRLPCVYLVDSGGAFLPLQDEVFPPRALRPHLLQPGQSVRRRHSADRGGDGQLHRRRRVCAGNVGRNRHRQEQGTIFLGGPPLVKAATGEVVTAEELGGGDVHARVSGVADHLAQNDAHALSIARRIVSGLNWRKQASCTAPSRARRATRPRKSTA